MTTLKGIEHPVLFKGEMVHMIMVGQKVQTRRVITKRNSFVDGSPAYPFWHELDFDAAWVDKGPSPAGNPGPYLKVPRPDAETVHRVYPKWQVGDYLWVRETLTKNVPETERCCALYAADGEPVKNRLEPKWNADTWWTKKLLSSIHMPRWASRITLEVLAVKPEPIQMMNYYDWIDDFAPSSVDREKALASYTGYEYMKKQIRDYWNSINGKKYPYDQNPLCWCYTFKRIVQDA